EVGTGKEQQLTGGHRGPVSALGMSPDGKTLASRGGDNVIRRWDAVTGKELGAFPTQVGTQSAAFSPDGRTVALGVGNTVRLIDVAGGKELHQLKGPANGSTALVFSPDGKVLAARGNTDIRLYEVARGVELKSITLPVNKDGPVAVGVVQPLPVG